MKKLTKDYDVNIVIDDEDGRIKIIGNDPENIKRVKEIAEKITRDIEVGQKFKGVVTRIEPYGAFVEVLPGKLGLVHISKMGGRVRDINNILKVGDEIDVEVINIDELGRLQLKRIVSENTKKKNSSR